jgi:hypothetical protein
VPLDPSGKLAALVVVNTKVSSDTCWVAKCEKIKLLTKISCHHKLA